MSCFCYIWTLLLNKMFLFYFILFYLQAPFIILLHPKSLVIFFFIAAMLHSLKSVNLTLNGSTFVRKMCLWATEWGMLAAPMKDNGDQPLVEAV